jgi:small conductance mechanosensitive channel
MQEFFNDIINYIENYYYAAVKITPKLILAIIVFIIAWFIASKVHQFSGNRLRKRMRDPLLANFIARLFKSILLIIGVLCVLRIIGLTGIAQTLLASAGISAFIIGFALKDIGENFLAGILLAFKRPFKIGDMVETNGVKGKVMALNLRDTQIMSDGKDIFIPNALLIKNTLINYNSGGYLLQDQIIGLDYGSDYQRAIDLITDVLSDIEEVTNDSRSNSAVVTALNGTAVQILVRYWVKTDLELSNGRTKSKVLIAILQALKKEGFVLKKE